MSHDNLRALILAGGASSRFFPVNKIFADLTGCGRTMIQQAQDRVTAALAEGPHARFLQPEQLFVVTGAEFAGPIREQLDVPAANVLVEPARRNTWPAILWALAHLRHDDPRAAVVVLTADHVIGQAPQFRAQLTAAADLAREEDAIVTFGISPHGEVHAWTSFGAIRAADDGAGHPAPILQFEEKPSLAEANRMILEGGWTWNSGMFVMRVDVAERAMQALDPDMHAVYVDLCTAVAAGQDDAARRCFERLPARIPHPRDPDSQADCSIDFVIMTPLVTRTDTGVSAHVMRAGFPWTDLGNWAALREVATADDDGNVCVGDVQCRGVENSTLVAEPGCTLHAEGLDGKVVVSAASGWVLVVDEAAAADIKPLVERVRVQAAPADDQFECEGCSIQTTKTHVALFRQRGLEVTERDGAVTVRGS